MRKRTFVSSFVALGVVGMVACGQTTGSPDDAGERRDKLASAAPVPGFADLHLHMMAEEAFGGGWMHGKHTGPLDDCDGGLPASDHARVRADLSSLLQQCPGPLGLSLDSVPLLHGIFSVGGVAASEVIGMTQGTQGDTGLHLGRRHFGEDWPSWDTIAHQQSWEGALRQAHEGGLNITVMSAVSFDWLCEALPAQNRARGCDEMADVELQLQMAHELDARHDWLEIALSPADARRIIHEGKLAVVLSIEASHIFGNSPNWRAEFERFYALGVRTLQPVHQVDNRFAGAAPHNAIFHVAQYTETCHIDNDCGATLGGVTLGFDVDGQCRNTKGLTAEGEALLGEMMARGMLIDIAHVSERGVARAYELSQANGYYPLYVSHGHFREIMNPDLAKTEKTTPAEIVRMLRRTGGMFGLRTAHDETREYTHSGVANSCHGSSRSFAQAYEFGRQGLKVPMALGSDFNGFIQQTRPRFGEDGACSATFPREARGQAAAQGVQGPPPLGTEFDRKGLAHVGLLPDLLSDLDQLGVDTGPLRGSAETFLQMWERAAGPRAGVADPADDLDPSGVAPYLSQGERPEYALCDADADCGEDAFFCTENLPLVDADNECSFKRNDHDGCTRDGQCLSGECGGCFDTAGWCFTPDSASYGEACRSDRECSTGRCSADCVVNPTGVCLCDGDDDCGNKQYCGWGFNSGKCQNKKGRGAACAKDRECLSDKCRWSFTCA
ncbi:MAG: membrane dipeptidase [Polyangiaceae bacterium]|jgi:microsomal dipeptidase-like Zn-dependent dipeptidase|nr:membrane dipeptidase [Polyangiaceae bacterium]